MKKFAVILLFLLAAALLRAQELSFDKTERDFGKIDGSTQFATFTITNNSDKDFRIGGLGTSCNCVSAYIGKVWIKAGETVKLETSVKPNGRGKEEYYVILYDSNEKAVQRFTLKMDITDRK